MTGFHGRISIMHPLVLGYHHAVRFDTDKAMDAFRVLAGGMEAGRCKMEEAKGSHDGKEEVLWPTYLAAKY